MDITLLINKFLEDKKSLRDIQNDSMNIVNNQIYSWNFTNIPQPTTEELNALIPIIESELTAKAIEDISPRQIRMALLSQGLTESAIDSAINSLSSPSKEQAMIAWKYSTTFKRNAEAVAAIGALLNLSSEQLDALWKAAVVL